MNDFCNHGTPKLKDPMQGSLISLETNLRYSLDEARASMQLANPVEEIVARQINEKLHEVYSMVVQLRTARNAHHASST